jgi:hypothetical protein
LRIKTSREFVMTALDYEIRVAGTVPATLLEEFEGVHVVVHRATTVLRGPIVDQAALHGILNRLQGLDLELIDVHRLVGGDRATNEG